MDYVSYAIAFVAALVVASTIFAYWQSRSRGMSHDASLNESAVAGTFLSGSAIFGYIVAAIVY